MAANEAAAQLVDAFAVDVRQGDDGSDQHHKQSEFWIHRHSPAPNAPRHCAFLCSGAFAPLLTSKKHYNR